MNAANLSRSVFVWRELKSERNPQNKYFPYVIVTFPILQSLVPIFYPPPPPPPISLLFTQTCQRKELLRPSQSLQWTQLALQPLSTVQHLLLEHHDRSETWASCSVLPALLKEKEPTWVNQATLTIILISVCTSPQMSTNYLHSTSKYK